MRTSIAMILAAFILLGCIRPAERPDVDRESMIPAGAVKITQGMDNHPPQLHSDEYDEPVPLACPVNTKGAEDSAFFAEDGLYFFFTPDVDVPVEKQLLDNVTGIYFSEYSNGEFQEPERVWLQEPGKLSLDGCQFIQDNRMWFCSAREGYAGMHLFTAELVNEEWTSIEHVEDRLVEYEVGEMHLHGNELYFHSSRVGGKGNYDIWVTRKADGEWQEPENIEAVNTEEHDGWPYITPDGKELWFTRTYLGSPAIFKSERMDNEWQKPKLIVSSFAGEPTLGSEGNIYFTHHFYENGKMIEADIYVAYRK
ncbi:hypothetical protein GF318_04630 [Candidatus Micrarchaeota archaeon]|nr:hypothetical protein [Candidatus Micrarchaeota archaeon]